MIIQGDARSLPLADQSVQCCVTSSPYWGLRKYAADPQVWDGDATCAHEWEEERQPQSGGTGAASAKQLTSQGTQGEVQTPIKHGFCRHCGAWRGQLGLEPTPDLYVQHLVQVFREVKRVLKDDGTLWLNLGDSFATSPPGNKPGTGRSTSGLAGNTADNIELRRTNMSQQKLTYGCKQKDLVGIPWMVAFALRADGWYLRSDIIWAKGYSFHPTTAGSCMPESIKDRPTRGHEYLFLLTKSAQYYYDYDAVQEDGVFPAGTRAAKGSGTREGNRRGNKKHAGEVDGATRVVNRIDEARDNGAPHGAGLCRMVEDEKGYAVYSGKRNLRSVWLINPKPFRDAHFATFPPALVTPCITAGSRPGDTVLDPFSGAGTTVMVAESLGRTGVGIELSPTYVEIAERRLSKAGERDRRQATRPQPPTCGVQRPLETETCPHFEPE